MYYMKNILLAVVFIAFSNCNAGSLDDFFEAVVQDKIATLQQLKGLGFDVNTVNARGQGALYLALRQPAPNVTSWLLTLPDLKVDARTGDDETPLMMAALKGNLAVCKALIARGADVNKPGWTPLHYAASGGHVGVIGLLLEENAYVDAASPNGTTPLMMAARYGSDEAVDALLLAGADATLRNDQGLDALDFARQGERGGAVDRINRALNPGAVQTRVSPVRVEAPTVVAPAPTPTQAPVAARNVAASAPRAPASKPRGW